MHITVSVILLSSSVVLVEQGKAQKVISDCEIYFCLLKTRASEATEEWFDISCQVVPTMKNLIAIKDNSLLIIR